MAHFNPKSNPIQWPLKNPNVLSCFLIWKWKQSQFPLRAIGMFVPVQGQQSCCMEWRREGIQIRSSLEMIRNRDATHTQTPECLRISFETARKKSSNNNTPLVWENFESFTCLRCPFKRRRTTKKIGTRGHKFIAERCSEFLLRWGPWIMTDQPTVGRILFTMKLMFWDEFISCISSDDFEKSTQQGM